MGTKTYLTSLLLAGGLGAAANKTYVNLGNPHQATNGALAGMEVVALADAAYGKKTRGVALGAAAAAGIGALNAEPGHTKEAAKKWAIGGAIATGAVAFRKRVGDGEREAIADRGNTWQWRHDREQEEQRNRKGRGE